MTWPNNGGGLIRTKAAVPPPVPAQPLMQRMQNPGLYRAKHYGTARGCYAIEGNERYLYYWDTVPPTEDTAAKGWSESSPYTTPGQFTDGVYYFAMRKTNGFYVSPFYPVGPNGEGYLIKEFSSGSELTQRPGKPFVTKLIQCAGGVIDVMVGYFEYDTSVRADQICITVTYDGSAPGQDSPDHTIDIEAQGPVFKTYSLAAQSHGITVKVRPQMRRNDGTAGSPVWRYSDTDNDDILTIAADAQGPAVPMDAEYYPGIVKD